MAFHLLLTVWNLQQSMSKWTWAVAAATPGSLARRFIPLKTCEFQLRREPRDRHISTVCPQSLLGCFLSLYPWASNSWRVKWETCVIRVIRSDDKMYENHVALLLAQGRFLAKMLFLSKEIQVTSFKQYLIQRLKFPPMYVVSGWDFHNKDETGEYRMYSILSLNRMILTVPWLLVCTHIHAHAYNKTNHLFIIWFSSKLTKFIFKIKFILRWVIYFKVIFANAFKLCHMVNVAVTNQFGSWRLLRQICTTWTQTLFEL